MANLITVPSFIFDQNTDEEVEQPIWVQYWNNCISLEQDGQSINILPASLDKLVKEIKKNQAQAEKFLAKR